MAKPTDEKARASHESALASVPSREAKLIASEEGLWLILESGGKSAMINLSEDDHGRIVNSVIKEILAELRAEKSARHNNRRRNSAMFEPSLRRVLKVVQRPVA